MKSIKLALISLLLVAGSSFSLRAADLHFIMCGGEVREADQTVVDAFVANNSGVNVNIEAVPWGTCQDKSLHLQQQVIHHQLHTWDHVHFVSLPTMI